MSVKLLTDHRLEFLSLTGGCRGSSESTLVKMSNCWKSHAAAHIGISLATLRQDKYKILGLRGKGEFQVREVRVNLYS